MLHVFRHVLEPRMVNPMFGSVLGKVIVLQAVPGDISRQV
jgi:hypothetical protein